MKEIIEDTITRNRKFQKERNFRVKRLKELRAPQDIIEEEEMIAQMTIAEYAIYLEEQEKKFAARKSEYAKNNPVQKHIIDEIYSRGEKLEYDYITYISDYRFLCLIHPLTFMSQEDYDYDLYQTFLNHAHEIYNEKYRIEYNNQEKSKDLGEE